MSWGNEDRSVRGIARDGSVFGNFTNVVAWFHTLMQHTNNFDQTRPDRAVVENVDGPLHFRLPVVGTGMPDMKTANAAPDPAAIPRRGTVRITRHLAHGHRDRRGVAAPALGSPPLIAGGENPLKVRRRQSRQAKTRHRDQRESVPDSIASASR
jgi:hypothetical protein